MITIRTTGIFALALTLAAIAGAAALAQGGTINLSGQNTYVGPAPDTKTKSAYKKATWNTYQTALKGGTTSREIPPTDCPPLPPKDCLDTWDDELTTSSPSR